MAWGRLDDGFHDHPKVGGLTLAAVGLWTMCFSWCNRHRATGTTPGFIPNHQPKRFGATPKLIRELVDAGLWDVVDGGWQMHDFEHYLPKAQAPTTAAEVRAARSEAGRRGAQARWHGHGNRDDKPDGNLPSIGMATPDGKPMPPSRTHPNKGGGLPANVRPDPWCDLHPGGTQDPCRPCRDARQQAETWQPPTPVPPTKYELENAPRCNHGALIGSCALCRTTTRRTA